MENPPVTWKLAATQFAIQFGEGFFATLAMVFKLGIEAQKHWRRLNGSALLPKWSLAFNLSTERS